VKLGSKKPLIIQLNVETAGALITKTDIIKKAKRAAGGLQVYYKLELEFWKHKAVRIFYGLNSSLLLLMRIKMSLYACTCVM